MRCLCEVAFSNQSESWISHSFCPTLQMSRGRRSPDVGAGVWLGRLFFTTESNMMSVQVGDHKLPHPVMGVLGRILHLSPFLFYLGVVGVHLVAKNVDDAASNRLRVFSRAVLRQM